MSGRAEARPSAHADVEWPRGALYRRSPRRLGKESTPDNFSETRQGHRPRLQLPRLRRARAPAENIKPIVERPSTPRWLLFDREFPGAELAHNRISCRKMQ